MRRFILGLLVIVAVLSHGSTTAQSSCGWRSHVVVLHVIDTSTTNPPYLFVEFDDAGPPLMDFLSAAARASTLVKDGAWWSAPTTPGPKHFLYPPGMIQHIELRHYCQ